MRCFRSWHRRQVIHLVPRGWAGLAAPAACYLTAMLAVNLTWEIAQLPLYTPWGTGLAPFPPMAFVATSSDAGSAAARATIRALRS